MPQKRIETSYGYVNPDLVIETIDDSEIFIKVVVIEAKPQKQNETQDANGDA